MTAREARNRRRAEERKVRKLEDRRMKSGNSAVQEVAEPTPSAADMNAPKFVPCSGPSSSGAATDAAGISGFVSQSTQRAVINRANAQHSMGPCTATGKLASSRNSLKHGLSTGQVIIPGEDAAAFEALRVSLVEEHQPATPTEELLVNEMAQSYWLEQRAIRLQNQCFAPAGIDEKRLSLFLRYQTTHHRGFHKALNTLLKLKKDRQKADRGFVSQKKIRSANDNGFVSQIGALQSAEIGFVSQEPPVEPPPAINWEAQAA